MPMPHDVYILVGLVEPLPMPMPRTPTTISSTDKTHGIACKLQHTSKLKINCSNGNILILHLNYMSMYENVILQAGVHNIDIEY